MGRIRVYIKPFDDAGNYTSFTEVTSDVDTGSISSIKREIDSTEYDAGVFKFSSISLRLANEHGKYSDVDTFQSIFRYKRTDSIVKITYDPNTDDTPLCGQFIANDADVTVFEGLLNDEATTLNIRDQKIKFRVLGYESMFKRMATPYSSLSGGDNLEEIVLACIDQAPFNNLVTVSAGNISLATDLATDAIADLENTTVKEALDELLLLGNSVLYIEDNTVYVTDRSASASVEQIFYGQASNAGVEDIINLTGIREGANRVLNYWTWDGAANLSEDQTSSQFFGIKKKQVSSELITNTTKITTILDALRDEFKDAKQEMNLETPMTWTKLKLGMLDKIQVDYPTVVVAADENNPVPIWGAPNMIWGSFKWPEGQWSLTIPSDRDFKIIGITHNLKRDTITYKIREV